MPEKSWHSCFCSGQVLKGASDRLPALYSILVYFQGYLNKQRGAPSSCSTPGVPLCAPCRHHAALVKRSWQLHLVAVCGVEVRLWQPVCRRVITSLCAFMARRRSAGCIAQLTRHTDLKVRAATRIVLAPGCCAKHAALGESLAAVELCLTLWEGPCS
jgi:hypothetical protein